MRWQRQEARPVDPAAAAGSGNVPARLERTSPGLAAFFAGLPEDRSHTLLDLGRASGTALSIYGAFARWVHFADLLDQPGSVAGSVRALSPAKEAYDLVLAWDLLDRVRDEEREEVVELLAGITAPGARLYLIVGATRDGATPPRFRFELRDLDRMVLEPVGPGELPTSPLLPAAVQRVLAPFQIVRGFSADIGIREYYAVRPESPDRPTGVPATRSALGRTE